MATLDKTKLKKSKRTKIKAIAAVTIGQIFAAIYFASVIHQVMSFIMHLAPGKALTVNYHFLYAVNGLINNHGIQLWFALLEIMYMGYIMWLLLKPSATIKDIREIIITDNIRIPVAVGNGQYGNARFTTKEEQESLFEQFMFNGNLSHHPGGRGGLVVGAKNINGKDYFQYVGKNLHSMIIGATGAGKTRRILLQSVCLQLMAGNCSIVSDVKGEIYYYTHKFAESLGYKTIAIDLCNSAKSAHYNYLQPIIEAVEAGRKKWQAEQDKLEKLFQELKKAKEAIAVDLQGEESIAELEEKYKAIVSQTSKIEHSLSNHALDYSWTKDAQMHTWDLVSVLVGDQPKGEPLWYNGESATLAACILIVCMEAGEEQYQNLYNVYLFLAYMSRMDEETGICPLTAYLETLEDQHPAKFIFMQSQAAAERTRSSFYTSVLGDLRLFTDPSIADMTASSDFSLSDIGTQKIVLYLVIPDEKKTYYPLAAALISQLYVAQVGTARKHGGALPIPTDYDLDEIGNFPTLPVMGGLMSAGRSRNIRGHLVIQDYQQLYAKYKDDAETIKTCCAVKVYLKSDNPKTLEEISKKLDKYTVEVASASTSSHIDKINDANISNSSNMTGRELLMPAEIGMIHEPYALVMVTGERPTITYLPDLSKYHLNKVLGLGSEEHNKKLIEMYENARPERDISYPPQWGIWSKFMTGLEGDSEKEKPQKPKVGLGFLNISN